LPQFTRHFMERPYPKVRYPNTSSCGYKFKKAKKVLTSSDPEYREKLSKITQILSELTPNEKFFSMTSLSLLGKVRGGVALVPDDEIRTIPQRQKSKGSLICTAALELSTNQVTHFYSSQKNTREMIKLLTILIQKYNANGRYTFHGTQLLGMPQRHSTRRLKNEQREISQQQYDSLSRACAFADRGPIPECN